MPEALIPVPPLQMPSDSGSDPEPSSGRSDASSAASSTRYGRSPHAGSARRRSVAGGPHSKATSRKTMVGWRSQKLPLKSSHQQRNSSAALKLKSRIPRPLALTTAACSNPLATDHSVQCSSGSSASVTTSEQTLTAILRRQNSGLVLAFHQRKSVSQMDLQQFRRSMQRGPGAAEAQAIVPVQRAAEREADGPSLQQMFTMRDYGYGVMQDPRMAGMKIFASIMLNAWRKRRGQVKQLLEENSGLKSGATKGKNQLHVLNSLFRLEQKRNNDLSVQLKRSLEEANASKAASESLSSTLNSVKAEKSLLEQQLHTKQQELDALNSKLMQAKKDLLKAMGALHDLQGRFSQSQNVIKSLENQKSELIKQILGLNIKAKLSERDLGDKLQAEANKSQNLRNQIDVLKERWQTERREFEEKLLAANEKLQMAQQQVAGLEHCLDRMPFNRLKRYWRMSLNYSQTTLEMLHWCAYYLMPATPPPSCHVFPVGLNLARVLRVVKY